MDYPARICHEGEMERRQGVAAHCRGCADGAAAVMESRFPKAAYLAGLLHDMGKYSDEYRAYIEKASRGESVRRGSVNHTFAGVRFALERWHSGGKNEIDDIACELIACAAGGHHGLFDFLDSDGKSGLVHRVTKEGIPYGEVKGRFLADCAALEELDSLFAEAAKEFAAVCEDCTRVVKSEAEMLFNLSLIGRLLLSAVIDGDRRDAAAFTLNTTLPKPPENPDAVWAQVLKRVERRYSEWDRTSPLDAVRSKISDDCAEAADRPAGIYRLTVPTGGGKTITSLRYALTVAAKQKKRRIIFATPLLAVLDQNQEVIRDWVGDNSLILEHHSNVVQEKNEHDELDINELFTQTWGAPIIITTLVQLLNTMFLGKTSCVRRTHALCDAVVVIDEVQSVPRNMLTLFNLALNFFSKVFSTTFVLCSATQPALEYAAHPIQFGEPAELVSLSQEARALFRRTKIIDRRRDEGYTPEEIADFARACIEENGSALLICNTKAQARCVFEAARFGDDVHVFHLSTAMCMAHRMDTLKKINDCLEAKLPVFCVSTQLSEAGIDFSFGCVLRLFAGLDNVVQAAGRCNRSGEKGRICPVYILDYRDETLKRLKEIRAAQEAAKAVLLRLKTASAEGEGDPASDAAILAYYRELYKEMPARAQDFYVEARETSIYAMLSTNVVFAGKGDRNTRFLLPQAFKSAGAYFQVFDDSTQDVLVPYEKGKECIENLCSEKAKRTLAYRGEVLAQAKGFTVSLRTYEIENLRKSGGIYTLYDGTVCVLRDGFYSEKTGIVISGDKY